MRDLRGHLLHTVTFLVYMYFGKFLMRENGFTASNICRQTNTSVALLYGQSMEVIGTRRQVLISFLSGKTHLSLSTLLI